MTSIKARYTSEPSDLYDTSEALHCSRENLPEYDDNSGMNELAPLTESSSNLEYESITNSIFAKPMAESSLVRRHRGIDQHSIDALGSALSNRNGDVNDIESIIQEYTSACQIYGCADRINAGILTTLRYRLPSLRVSGSFFDGDMLALAELLLHHVNGALSYIKRLDFSLAAREGKQHGKKGIRSHGAYALSKVLQISKFIEEVFLPGNRIGPYGASAIFCAAKNNPTLRTLLMRGCRIGERGAFALVSQILVSEDEATGRRCGLREIDMSCNQIGFYGVFAIEKSLKKRREKVKARLDNEDKILDSFAIEVDLEGNLIFQEVMNCVTHGLGIVLAILATIFLSNAVKGKPPNFIVSCAIYSTSLIVLYLSSTLYHSFFLLQRTRYIFQVFDMCSIYILIAGSYTPFLSIVIQHQMLLAFIWLCGISGIGVEAFFPLWKWKPKFSLAMYLGMGWSCMVCMKELVAALSSRCLYLLVAGGILYTAGVPFFVRNNNLDHSIWHCFVMMGSICHWCSIYAVVRGA